MATDVPIPKRLGKPKSVAIPPSAASNRLHRRHSIAVSSNKSGHEAKTNYQHGSDNVRGLLRGRSVESGKLICKKTSLDVNGIIADEDDVWLKYDDCSEEETLADRIKSIVLDTPLVTEKSLSDESHKKLSDKSNKAEKLRILQKELSAESKIQKQVKRTDKSYTDADVQKFKDELDFSALHSKESRDKSTKKFKTIKRYKGDLRNYKKESCKSCLKKDCQGSVKTKQKNSKEDLHRTCPKKEEQQKSAVERTSKSSQLCLVESGSENCTKSKIHQNDRVDRRGNSSYRCASESDLLQSELTYSSKLLRSNTNITDSEKIYHKLQGLSKVSKLGCVSPKSRRLSLTSECVDATLDTTPKARNGLRYIPIGSDTVVKTGDKIVKTGDGSSRFSNSHQLLVRQCRIGSSVAFGLVQVNVSVCKQQIHRIPNRVKYICKY